MFRYVDREGEHVTQWTGEGPLTIETIQAEALELMKARAVARASQVYNYERDDLGHMIAALARLALQTDYGDDAESGDISELADCVVDYLTYWGEQLECSPLDTWKPGLDGVGFASVTVDDITHTYRVRYRPHRYLGHNDHMEFQLVYDDQRPSKRPNPVSETGYRSVFVPSRDIDMLANPQDWVVDYLKQCVSSWEQPENAMQLSLFN